MGRKALKITEIAILSGKGGTGKTSLLAALAAIAGPHVTVDCDVDAANLALLRPGKDTPNEDFFSGQRAVVDPDRCNGCGICESECRFDAIAVNENGVAEVDNLSCEGCGVCKLVCPEEAITFRANLAGVWCVRKTDSGPLVHAELGIAQDNSGKLVAGIRKQAQDQAKQKGFDLILIDGPPGIGCPVHAALAGVDLLVAVTEPTPAGEHDLHRLLELARHFQIKATVWINKADINPEGTEKLKRSIEEMGLTLIGELPFNKEVPQKLSEGLSPLAVAGFRELIEQGWQVIRDQV
jgi:MinD superfamily P-loop ATPase